MLFLTWLLASPFIIFQAMLSSIDDHGISRSVDHIKTLVPLLIVVGIAAIVVFVQSLSYRNSFRVRMCDVFYLCRSVSLLIACL
jgi:hypothetical protein